MLICMYSHFLFLIKSILYIFFYCNFLFSLHNYLHIIIFTMFLSLLSCGSYVQYSQDLAHSKLFFWSLVTWMTTWTEHIILGSQFSLTFLKYYSAFDISGLVKFSSVDQSRLTLCDPMDCSTPGLTIHHQFPEFTQTHVHWVGDAIQPSHPLSPPSPSSARHISNRNARTGTKGEMHKNAQSSPIHNSQKLEIQMPIYCRMWKLWFSC